MVEGRGRDRIKQVGEGREEAGEGGHEEEGEDFRGELKEKREGEKMKLGGESQEGNVRLRALKKSGK